MNTVLKSTLPQFGSVYHVGFKTRPETSEQAKALIEQAVPLLKTELPPEQGDFYTDWQLSSDPQPVVYAPRPKHGFFFLNGMEADHIANQIMLHPDDKTSLARSFVDVTDHKEVTLDWEQDAEGSTRLSILA